MTSKKTAASKGAALPRASDYTKAFLKDRERLSRSGRYDMNRLKEAMLLLIANTAALPPEWLDHALTRRLDWPSRVPHRWGFSADLQLGRGWQTKLSGVRAQRHSLRAVFLKRILSP
jgi:hypothetical protein